MTHDTFTHTKEEFYNSITVKGGISHSRTPSSIKNPYDTQRRSVTRSISFN